MTGQIFSRIVDVVYQFGAISIHFVIAPFITKIAKNMPRKYQHQFSRKTTSSKARRTTLGITRPLKIKNRGIDSKKSSAAHKYTTTFYNNKESGI